MSTVLNDYSRCIIAWKLCSTMQAEDVIDALDMALAASGCDQAHLRHNHACSAIIAAATSPASWQAILGPGDEPCSGLVNAFPDPGQDRALAPYDEEPFLLESYFLPGDLEAQISAFVVHCHHRRYH